VHHVIAVSAVGRVYVSATNARALRGMTSRTNHERVFPEVADGTGELVYANGIDATTGEYLLPPLPPGEIAELARNHQAHADMLATVAKATATSGAARLRLEQAA